MTKRRNYPRLRNGKLHVPGLPPHFVLDSKKQVVFHIPGGFPATMGIPTWMKSFPDDYKSIVTSDLDEFKRYKAKANEP